MGELLGRGCVYLGVTAEDTSLDGFQTPEVERSSSALEHGDRDSDPFRDDWYWSEHDASAPVARLSVDAEPVRCFLDTLPVPAPAYASERPSSIELVESMAPVRLDAPAEAAPVGMTAALVVDDVRCPLVAITTNTKFIQAEFELLEVELGLGSTLASRLEEVSSAARNILTAVREIAIIVDDRRPLTTSARSCESNLARAVDWAVRATVAELRHRARLEVAVEEVAALAIEEHA